MITYRFSSIESLADYFANKASEWRQVEIDERPRITKRDRTEARGQAIALEGVVHMLRNMRIGEDKQ